MKKIAICLASVLLAGAALSFSGCGEDKKLWQHYKDYFKIGCTMNYGTQDIFDDIAGEFNSMTCENEMKWVALQPNEGQYNYTSADNMVSFAKEHGMSVRGHCLAWHNPLALPGWVFSVEGEDGKPAVASYDKVKERLVTHATEVVTHFGDDIYAWDVWNEVITDNYTEDDTDLYRLDSQWHTVAGLSGALSPDERNAVNDKIEDLFIATFDAARKANPDAKLFYNDYFANNQFKAQKLLTVLDRLLEKGCEIDGVGIQAHYDITSFDWEMLENLIVQISARGLEVQITEIDFSMYDYNGDIALYYHEFTEDMAQLQASCFGKAFEIFRKHKDKITCVTQWGVADDDSYLHKIPVAGRQDWPYLFDEYHAKKPAYYAVIDF